MLIDTHCHLHDAEWFTPEQQETFLTQAQENGVEKVICIGTDPEDSLAARAFAEKHENVYWTYGVHPEHARQEDFEELSASPRETKRALEPSAKSDGPVKTGAGAGLPSEKWKVLRGPVAIGEIGLDYHYEDYNREAQIRLFEQMLQLAKDENLPVSLHIREAFADAFAVLDNFPGIIGVVHSFTGSKKELQKALERDFFIGVNGLCTYTTNPLPPLEKMLLETDAPFLTPNPFRGTINSPAYVKIIATYLAGKLGVAESVIMEQTTKNARTIFQI